MSHQIMSYIHKSRLAYVHKIECMEDHPWSDICSDEPDPLPGRNGVCRFCSHRLRETDFTFSNVIDEDVTIHTCDRCGWWCEFELAYRDDSGWVWQETPAVLRRYECSEIDVPVTALRRELVKRPYLLHNIHWKKMEKLTRSILSDFMDCEALHVGRSRDNGVDIMLLNGNKQYLVQVKHPHNPSKGQSIRPIKELVGTMVGEGSQYGIFVTSADHFSKPAAEYAVTVRRRPVVEKFHLLDSKRLHRLLQLVAPKSPLPWEVYHREMSDYDGIDSGPHKIDFDSLPF